jgi:hypothetical protein
MCQSPNGAKERGTVSINGDENAASKSVAKHTAAVELEKVLLLDQGNLVVVKLVPLVRPILANPRNCISQTTH